MYISSVRVFGRIIVTAALIGTAALAQSPLATADIFAQGLNGFQVYSASASFGYNSIANPGSGGASNLLGGDYNAVGSVSMGYQRVVARTNIGIIYTPSYFGRIRYPELGQFNQSLGFTVARDLTPRWNFTLTGSGSEASVDRYLFVSPVVVRLARTRATVDELAAALTGGQYKNNQLSSIVTDAPVNDAPSERLLYGSRVLTAGLQAGTSYSYSSRLSFGFYAGALRTQTLQDKNADPVVLAIFSSYSLPRTSSVHASSSLSYSWRSRTTLGLNAHSNRVISRLNDYYLTGAGGSIGQRIGQHFIGTLQGGMSVSTVVRATASSLPSGDITQAAASAS